MTSPLENPSVFSTAISCCRSRTAMLIVFAVTSRMVNATAMPMTFSSSARLPARATKPARKACSVSVLVWLSLFSNAASISFEIAPACDGSSICTVSVPIPTVSPVASYRYLKLKYIELRSVPG